jgi:hypothetical protein
MTRDDIIRMAREAGFSQPWTAPTSTQERLERFAALVAAYEREACAQICEEEAKKFYVTDDVCAYLIRARNNHD